MDDKATCGESRAMSSFATIVVLTLVLTVVVALVRTVQADGLGHRPPPRVRPDAEADDAW